MDRSLEVVPTTVSHCRAGHEKGVLNNSLGTTDRAVPVSGDSTREAEDRYDYFLDKATETRRKSQMHKIHLKAGLPADTDQGAELAASNWRQEQAKPPWISLPSCLLDIKLKPLVRAMAG